MQPISKMLAVGRKRSGRQLALDALDSILSHPAAQTLLAESFKDRLTADPVAFFETFVMPLLPKESLVRHGGDEDVRAPIRIMMTDENGSSGIDAIDTIVNTGSDDANDT